MKLLRSRERAGVTADQTTRAESSAELRLNTAELNSVVLALYLLCGPTIPNVLGALVLDDLLQNMDELTSANPPAPIVPEV